MSQRIHHTTPPALSKKGITRVTETVPCEGPFRIKGAGSQLALLFREELMQRMAAKARTGKGGQP